MKKQNEIDWQLLQIQSQFLNQETSNLLESKDFSSLIKILQSENPLEENQLRKKNSNYLNFEPQNMNNLYTEIVSKC